MAQARPRDEKKTAPEYLRTSVERDLLAGRSFSEILKPVRSGFEESGISEDELDSFVVRPRRGIYARTKVTRRTGRP